MENAVLFTTDTRGLIKLEDDIHHGTYKLDCIDTAFLPYMLIPRWSGYQGGPKTQLGLYQSEEYFIFVFKMTGEYIKCLETDINSSVHEDSCVEVFIESGSNKYLNIEVNALGTIHAAEGEERFNRNLKDKVWIDSNTKFYTTVNKSQQSKNKKDWHCTLNIRKSSILFNLKQDDVLSKYLRINVHKCGDLTFEPHYLTLFPIKTLEPDFHRPEFFNKVKLC